MRSGVQRLCPCSDSEAAVLGFEPLPPSVVSAARTHRHLPEQCLLTARVSEPCKHHSQVALEIESDASTEDQLLADRIYMHRITLVELSLQDGQGQWVLHLPLDHALERTCAKRRVIAIRC
jgi:hypothetical protein